MQIQISTDYAVRILQHLHMVQSSQDAPLQTAMTISSTIGITYPYFIKLVNLLKKSRLLETIQAGKGGYRLARPADEISIYDVFIAMEGEVQISSPFKGENISCNETSKTPQGWNKFLWRMQEMTASEMKMQSIKDLDENLRFPVNRKSHPHVLQSPASIIEIDEERYYKALTTGEQERLILFDEILLFQSGSKPNTIEVYTERDTIQVRGKITRIARVSSEFFSIHHSYTVNLNHVRRIDEAKKEIELSSGRIVPIVSTKVKALIDRLAMYEQEAQVV